MNNSSFKCNTSLVKESKYTSKAINYQPIIFNLLQLLQYNNIQFIYCHPNVPSSNIDLINVKLTKNSHRTRTAFQIILKISILNNFN